MYHAVVLSSYERCMAYLATQTPWWLPGAGRQSPALCGSPLLGPTALDQHSTQVLHLCTVLS